MNFSVVNLSSKIAASDTGPALRRRRRVDSRALIRAAAAPQLATELSARAMPTGAAANESGTDRTSKAA